MSYEIDSQQPVPPPPAKGRKLAYPLDRMGVGDSFAFAEPDLIKVRRAVVAYARRHGGKFTVRKEQLRCWRVS